MNVWTMVSILLMMLCGGLAAFCFHLKGQLSELRERAAQEEEREREGSRLRADCLRARRESTAMRRALEQEQDRSDAFEEALNRCQDCLNQAEERLHAEEKKRIEAEKDVSAGQMRARLLEHQMERTREEMAVQEQLYQDILREREETIVRLQDQQHRRSRKKTEVLDQQVTLNDLLKGM